MAKLEQTNNRDELETLLADYVGSQGDHNSREAAKRLMDLADDYRFYLKIFHDSLENS